MVQPTAQESTEPYILMVMYTMVMYTAGRNQCNYNTGMHRYELYGVNHTDTTYIKAKAF